MRAALIEFFKECVGECATSFAIDLRQLARRRVTNLHSGQLFACLGDEWAIFHFGSVQKVD